MSFATVRLSLIVVVGSTSSMGGALAQDVYMTVDGHFAMPFQAKLLSRVAACGDMDHDGTEDFVIGATTSCCGGDVSVVSGATGAFIHEHLAPNQNSAEYGSSVDGAGDFDRDGTPDFVVGAPGWNPGAASKQGMVLVHSGRTGQTITMVPGNQANAEFGWRVAGIGDVNQDGYDDIIAARSSNAVRVLRGPSGTVIRNHSGPFTRPSVAGLGDVDRDGVPDYIVGWPQDSTVATWAGRANVYSGIDGSEIHTVYGDGQWDHFGQSVTGIGDLNSDGYADFVVGAPGEITYTFGAATPGFVRVYSGKDASVLLQLDGPDDTPMFTYFGGALDAGKDVNGDGVVDLIVGAPRDDWWINTDVAGSTQVFSGKTGQLLWKLRPEVGVIRGKFGQHVAVLGDLDQDGLSEFANGDPHAGYTGSFAGRITVWRGARGDADEVCAGAPNSVGPGSDLSFYGPIGVGNDELSLRIGGAPPGESGLFFFGAESTQVPLGDGFLCVGAGNLSLYRLGVHTITPAGTAEQAIDFASNQTGPDAWVVGSSWTFQFWYRDPLGPLGTGFNFSSARSVKFMQ